MQQRLASGCPGGGATVAGCWRGGRATAPLARSLAPAATCQRRLPLAKHIATAAAASAHNPSAAAGPSSRRRSLCRARSVRTRAQPAAGGRSAPQQPQQQQQQPPEEEAEAVEGEAEEEGEEGDFGPLDELSEARHVIIESNFDPVVDDLRAVFDARFENPRSNSRERFLWDYWHVEGQYSLIRTQAAAYFPKPLYKRLESALLSYGERNLGCRAISPVWMSYYVDGCAQELHCDSFHGPYAFVLSLTRWDEREFTGGETMILKPTTLDFWSGFVPGKGLEMGDLVTLVPPRYNQLTLFDPRLPHGVRPVRGTRDPMKSRLVLHGWFTEPSPFIEGALEPELVVEALNAAVEPVFEELEELPAVLGVLTARVTVSGADGTVSSVEFLADTLVVRPGQVITDDDGDPLPDSAARAAVHHAVHEGLSAAAFPACDRGDTFITYPFVFE